MLPANNLFPWVCQKWWPQDRFCLGYLCLSTWHIELTFLQLSLVKTLDQNLELLPSLEGQKDQWNQPFCTIFYAELTRVDLSCAPLNVVPYRKVFYECDYDSHTNERHVMNQLMVHPKRVSAESWLVICKTASKKSSCYATWKQRPCKRLKWTKMFIESWRTFFEGVSLSFVLILGDLSQQKLNFYRLNKDVLMKGFVIPWNIISTKWGQGKILCSKLDSSFISILN